MRIFSLIFMFVAQSALANTNTTYNCSVTNSQISNLKAGDRFILSSEFDNIFGTTTYSVTAKSLGLNRQEVGAKPEVTVGEDSSYTLTMPNGSQFSFYLKFQSRDNSPALLTREGPQQAQANLVCQILN